MDFLSLFGALWLLSFGLALGDIIKLNFGGAPKASIFSTAELN